MTYWPELLQNGNGHYMSTRRIIHSDHEKGIGDRPVTDLPPLGSEKKKLFFFGSLGLAK